jgi:murein L,D-transpeptidase YafK
VTRGWRWAVIGLAVLIAIAAAVIWFARPALLPIPPLVPRKLADIRADVTPRLIHDLAARGLAFGSPVFIRIFKESSELEFWIARGDTYDLYKTFPICTFSGDLGPKLREGDRQSPEGIYAVAQRQLNPNSAYHLSFNLGFPNDFDRHHGRTGSHLMVHGNCVSVGCYAMTDPVIEVIYLLTEAALARGQATVPVHAFPFRMSEANFTRHAASPWAAFWRELKPIHDAFEARRRPPEVRHQAGRYQLAQRP